MRKPTARTREANGSRLLPAVDGRSWFVRYSQDIFALLLEHAGGPAISTPRRLLCQQVAFRAAQLMALTNRIAVDEAYEGRTPDPLDIDLCNRLAGSQRRDLEALGLDPVDCDRLPNLGDYLKQVTGECVG